MIGSNPDSCLPLKGLLVLDLTRLLPGPLCTMMLGDYGAEVIKVEDTVAGDPTRFVGPVIDGSGAFFRQLNRNKKSLAVNLKSNDGCEVLVRLAKEADILVEGFRPGVMDRLGLGYNDLASVNPRLVYASISGYGQKGPYRNRAGHDINYTAIAGLLDLSAAEAGAPVMPAVQIADIAGGSLNAINGIMFALYQCGKSGRGSHVDIAMTRGLLPWLTYAASGLTGLKPELPRRGSGYITGAYACYNLYETADGAYMSLGALEPHFWQQFCEAVGRPQWTPLQFDTAARLKLIEEVQALFVEKSRAEWEKLFAGVDACCEPVLSLQEAPEHPVCSEGGYWLDSGDINGGPEKLAGFPLLFDGASGEMRLNPPKLGEHTLEILKFAGYEEKNIEEMIRVGVVATEQEKQ
jgi:crotonobetainyl-CoA:carnitine CoA-transferase CaiB-like acyl-CoA transferase